MVELYVTLVLEGVRTIEGVPQRYRAEVLRLVNEKKGSEEAAVAAGEVE